MAPSPIVILPIRDFTGMSRLEPVLGSSQRRDLSRRLCERATEAARRAGLTLVVVSSSIEVKRWATENGWKAWPDPGHGLTAAATAAVNRVGTSPWILLHADLPSVSASSLIEVAAAASGATVLVPSHDGGTNVIASSGPFPFAYGLGSFHRHFAKAPDAIIISNAELSIDIDSPIHLAAFPCLAEPSTISP